MAIRRLFDLPDAAERGTRPASGGALLEVDAQRVSLSELVQCACQAGTTLRVEVWQDDEEIGHLVVVGGTVLSARADQRRGEDAFCRLADLPDAHLRVFRLAEEPREIEISTPLEDLLEAARWAERRARVKTRPVKPIKVASRDHAAAPAVPRSDDFDGLFREALVAYMRREIPLARALFERCLELRPHDARARHNLKQIQARGDKA